MVPEKRADAQDDASDRRTRHDDQSQTANDDPKGILAFHDLPPFLRPLGAARGRGA